jgi:hypothetical protein
VLLEREENIFDHQRDGIKPIFLIDPARRKIINCPTQRVSLKEYSGGTGSEIGIAEISQL